MAAESNNAGILVLAAAYGIFGTSRNKAMIATATVMNPAGHRPQDACRFECARPAANLGRSHR